MGLDSSSKVWERCGKQAIDGDAEALGNLLECFRPMLLSTARRSVSRRIRASMGASDIVQLTCQEAYMAVQRIHARDSRQFASWLMRLLKNNLIDAHRKYVGCQKRSKQREIGSERLLEALESSEPGGLESLLRHEERELLHSCIQRLSVSHRELMRWHLIDGKSEKDIARTVDRSAEAVRMALNRAKAALRREMLSPLTFSNRDEAGMG